MNNKVRYTSKELFDILLNECIKENNITERYKILRNVFYRIIEQRLMDSCLMFSGLFSKVDYIIKEDGIPADVAQEIHDTRRILFPQGGGSSLKELNVDQNQSFPYDLKAVCLLLSYIDKDTSIPEDLKKRFPKNNRISTWGHIDEHLLRVIVNEWDDSYIYANEEIIGKGVTICYGEENEYLTRGGKGNWKYLQQILNRNSQLNLVRIRMKQDVLYPELIIYEPDILVNITAIASCFDDAYKESPFVNLINKLKTDVPTIPIHLGNLASQFLDETIHNRTTTFSESMIEFFRRNALSMVACPSMSDATKVSVFYDDARRQKENIQKLVGNDLPNAIGGFEREKVILEPSFFSEVLGIQGRLDFLYEHDEKVVIVEQKSGKGAFIPRSFDSDPNVPNIQVKHWVQLLLYRALFIYEFRKSADDIKHIFLLYSKYSSGLLSTTSSPELFLRAIRIRNLLTWCEIMYSERGMDILNSMTSDSLRGDNVNERFWKEWKVPELNGVLMPIQNASPIEKAYYFRFLRFLSKEQMLGRVGNKVKENSGFASKWLDTIEDKHEAGNIYDNLVMESINETAEGVTDVTLKFADTQDTDTSNFRTGDIVILYRYRHGEVPNACAQMVHRASITSITLDNITLKLRNEQTDAHVMTSDEDTLWAIEHDMFESSSSALFQGMQRFLTASQERKDMILGLRELKIDDSLKLIGDYGRFNDMVLNAKRSRDLFLVMGPPGTGKTSFGMLNILQEELLEQGTNILLLSYTNRAVDEICSKLMSAGIDFIRIGSKFSCSNECDDFLLENRLRKCTKGKEVRDIIMSTRVFCATTAALNSNISLLTIKQFSLAIVDEASQILEPHLVGLLSTKCGDAESIGRLVLIGDHKQLPAVVQQEASEAEITDPILRNVGFSNCCQSFFERKIIGFSKNCSDYDERFVYMLTYQGRMHRDVADFPNIAFYDGKLKIVGSPILPHQDVILDKCLQSENGIDKMITTRSVAFVATQRPDKFISDKVNQSEANMIAATAVRIYYKEKENFDIDKTIGIIVPYRNQISTVRNAIDHYGIKELHDISIDTVERFQGSQREYILYGFTIQRRYQLNFLASNVFLEDGAFIDRKLNVAMTRARMHLVMYGNTKLLSENEVFAHLLKYVRENGDLIDVPEKNFCEGSFSLN